MLFDRFIESQRFSVNSRRKRTVMKRVAHGEPDITRFLWRSEQKRS